MKRILAIMLTISIPLCIAMNTAAASKPSNEPTTFHTAERPLPRKRHARRGGTTIPYLKNSRPIRVRRLSARERQGVFRRLIDIRID